MDMEQLRQDIDAIRKDVHDIRHIINGNGERGLAAKVQDHEEFMRSTRQRNADIVTILYRAAIGIAIGYLCLKVGLPKP